jgi:hypothetical protein
MYRRKIISTIFFLFLCFSVYAESRDYYFVNETLRLRNSPGLSYDTITTMPAETRLEYIESGNSDYIDGIRARWLKVRMHDGTEGWCFEGYLDHYHVADGVLDRYTGTAHTLKIPDSIGITALGDDIFRKNETIQTITVPRGVTRIGKRAFAESEITRIILPEGLLILGEESFDRCRIKAIELPRSLEIIDSRAFFWCNLESVTIPPHVTTLGDGAFDLCGIKALYLPASVTTIGVGAFMSQTLKKIQAAENNPAFTSRDGVLFTKDMKTLVAYPSGKEQERYVVPSEVLCIGKEAFGRCKNVPEVILPEGLEELSHNAFWDAEGVLSVPIPKHIKRIEQEAFNNSGLREAVIPSGVKKLEKGVFANCENMKKIALPASIAVIGDAAFAGCRSLEEIDLPQKLASIGEEAFQGCDALREVTFPSSLNSLGEEAFSYCKKLTRVTFKDSSPIISLISGPLVIERYAFSQCPSLEYVTFTSRTRLELGDRLFDSCPVLKEIHVSRKVDYKDSFEYCPAQIVYTD